MHKTIKSTSGHSINCMQYRVQHSTRPGVFFLGGYRSSLESTKIHFIYDLCRSNGLDFTAFEYSGHGKSGGAFADTNISHWLQDAVSVFTQLTQGPQLVVGSSMGGYLMCLLALKKELPITALVGIATACDFVSKLFMPILGEKALAERDSLGYCNVAHPITAEPYILKNHFFIDALQYDILDNAIDIQLPTQLIHGLKDELVPWNFSTTLAEQLTSKDVIVSLVKDGDHRLHCELGLKTIRNAILSAI